MSALFKKIMQEANRLTRSGSLQEATRAIQQALGRMAAPATPSSATQAAAASSAAAAARWDATGDVIDVVARAVHKAAHQPVSEPVRPIFTPARPASNDVSGEFIEAAFTHAVVTRSYKLYTPTHATSPITQTARPLPLVLMLHGCTQNPDDFAAGTGMNALALEHGFVVVYPAQNQKANAQRCWNWFTPGDQQRDSGEAAWLAALVQQVTQLRAIDPDRIFVAGLSAGGAMASILGHTHPDVFAAVGVHSGLACGVAGNMISALSVMKNGRSAAGAPSRLPTIVFHGDADKTVHPNNADAVLQTAIGQATTTAKATEGTAARGQSYTRTTYQTADGRSIAENWTLHGAGHAWSGGSSKGSYT
ncbi:MAG: PHB depolymerase family esterase, partial [Ferruginibacter sp.]|nr:PHB depolymerase family esterase [Rhodoferax sp.]